MNSRRRLPGLLLVAALMIPGPARPQESVDSHPDEGTVEETVDTHPETGVLDTELAPAERAVDTQPADAPRKTVDTQPNGDLDTQAETEGVDTQQTGKSDEERSTRASEDVFVPTEKVSEDLSVAFPVDI